MYRWNLTETMISLTIKKALFGISIPAPLNLQATQETDYKEEREIRSKDPSGNHSAYQSKVPNPTQIRNKLDAHKNPFYFLLFSCGWNL